MSHDLSTPTLKSECGTGTVDVMPTQDVKQEVSVTTDVDEDVYPISTGRFILIFVAFCVSFGLTALDQTILSTALPTIASQFHAISDLTWIASAYFLPQAGLMLLFGKILSIYYPKYVYLICIALFEIGSLICAVAPNPDVLIFGRAFAGVGAAGLWIAVMSLFARIATVKQRPMLLGAVGAVYAVCSVAGPIIGGALSEHATWRWCFWINLPCGGVAIVFVIACLPNLPPTDRSGGSKWRNLDYVGAFLSIAMVTLLLLPLQWGGNTRPWNDPVVIALLVVAIVLIVVFIGWEYRQGQNAILSVKMMTTGSMLGICLEAAFLNVCFEVTTYYLPLFYQLKGSSATHSGIDILPFMISGVLIAAIGGAVVSAWGHVWPFLFVAPLLGAIGGGLLFTVGIATHNAKLIGYQIILGCGLGAAIQNTIVTGQAQYMNSPELVSQATGLVTFMQLLGASIGLAVSSAILTSQLGSRLDAIPGLPADVKAAVRESIDAIPALPAAIKGPVEEAYLGAVKDVFMLIVGGAILASISALFISRRKVNVKM